MTIMNLVHAPGLFLRRMVTVYTVFLSSTFGVSNTQGCAMPWFGSKLPSNQRNLASQKSASSANPLVSDPSNSHLAGLHMVDNVSIQGGASENTSSQPSHGRRCPNHHPSPHHNDLIHRLIANPALYDPMRKPRFPIVLCHGLYGFDSRGPSSFPRLRMEYWHNVLSILRNTLGAEVIVTGVPSTGSIQERAEKLHRDLEKSVRGRGVNFLAHSMGGLDCRYLISHIKPQEYTPLSLMSVCTPHRGSPFMDWCAEYIGIGRPRKEHAQEYATKSPASDPPLHTSTHPDSDLANQSKATTMPNSFSDSFSTFSKLPTTFTTRILSLVDTPAYANLTSHYLKTVFNPTTPDSPSVKYFSVSGRMPGTNIWHPLWLPKLVMDSAEDRERARLKALWGKLNQGLLTNEDLGEDDKLNLELWRNNEEWGNDGLVTVQSAKWGEFLGVLEGCDHWEMRGARGFEFGVDLPSVPSLGLRLSAAGTVASSDEAHQNQSPSDREDANNRTWRIKELSSIMRAFNKEDKKNNLKHAEVSSYSTSRIGRDTRALRQARKNEDEIIQSTTDNLARVIDWLVDHVPTPPLFNSSATKSSQSTSPVTHDIPVQHTSDKARNHEKQSPPRTDLQTFPDLERFYLALSKKMYDEGL